MMTLSRGEAFGLAPEPTETCGHGVFTYYLLQGLHGEADANKDDTVTAGELFAYLSEKVSKATDGQQNPQAFPGLARNLPLSGMGVQKASTASLR